ncbi:hypothetical protein BB737_25590 [Mycobacterium avium subsp. hominissuis]|nr:hypothetical protein BI294_08190 [Mycobacterium avium subsp. hominissuis]PBJ59439.1 hypothetical protein BB736_14900 [Mycobacterium avium subsp. hominissuis]PBJ60440.1 hypothetical protein BB737_25590 [Mycobacterium avium subsp. hominissuis]
MSPRPAQSVPPPAHHHEFAGRRSCPRVAETLARGYGIALRHDRPVSPAPPGRAASAGSRRFGEQVADIPLYLGRIRHGEAVNGCRKAGAGIHRAAIGE